MIAKSPDLPLVRETVNLVVQHKSMHPPKKVGPSTTAQGCESSTLLARAIMLTVGVKQPPMRGTLACEKAVLLSIVPGTPLGNSQCWTFGTSLRMVKKKEKGLIIINQQQFCQKQNRCKSLPFQHAHPCGEYVDGTLPLCTQASDWHFEVQTQQFVGPHWAQLPHMPAFSMVNLAPPALLYTLRFGLHKIPQHLFSGISPPNATL